MKDLKLLALDEDDLQVISAHVQDAVVKVEDMGFAKADRRFALMLNRFAWENQEAPDNKSSARKRSALRFDGVLDVSSSGINGDAKDGVLELLSVQFDATEQPAGEIRLTFAGGGELKLAVECVEVRLSDLGAQWGAKSVPSHAV